MPQVRDTGRVSGYRGALRPVSPRVGALAFDGRAFFTKSAGGREAVYGEVNRAGEGGAKWRRWDPNRSKLAAALHAGGLTEVVESLFTSGPVLYLGAASGTTVSHVADLLAPEAVFAVESAARSFAELLEKLKAWTNVFPVHADARQPAQYASLVGKAGALIQDVAQPDQVEIAAANARAILRPSAGVALFIKARSVDSSADPITVFAGARARLVKEGFRMVEERALEPFDLDHRAFFLRAPSQGRSREPF